MPPQEVLYAENQTLKAEVAQLKVQIEWLKRKIFGGGQSETLDRAQLMLALGQLQAQLPAARPTATVTYQRPLGREKRPLTADTFAHLPVQETQTIVPAEVTANPDAFEQIAEEVTFEVDIIPPKLVKREFRRPKFRRKNDVTAAPIVAPAPARAVPGGYVSAGLIAYVAVAKYLRHLPLYRLAQMSQEWGAPIARQSMADWMRIAAEWGEVIYRAMLKELLEGSYIQIDETPIRYCDPDEKVGRTQQGYLWAVSHPQGDVVFDWRLSRRHGEVPQLIGEDYQGLLQSDGYEGYAAYCKHRPAVTWLGCWAHLRRHFFEAQSENPRVVLAVLKMIARMYRREAAWTEEKISTEERTRRRAGPEGLKRTMEALRKLAQRMLEQKRVLQKSQLGVACTYLLNQWEPLSAHLRHGASQLDNNKIENAIRPTALGKKNWLFFGHPDAGKRSAVLYSLIISCLRHRKDPHAYLRDILTRLPRMTNQEDITPLMPKNWVPAS